MRRKIIAAVAISSVCAEMAVLVRRRGFLIGASTIVRCRSGHLFTTLWIPGGSLKAIRLGWWRFQRCPIGRHFSLVTPVKIADLTSDEKQIAAQHRDNRVP